MATKTDRIENWLATALEMEQKGKDFYDQSAAKCKNELAKKFFVMLAKDEVVHMGRIKKLHAAAKKGGWSEDWKALELRKHDLSEVFRGLAKKHGPKINARTSDLQALDVAIDFEAQSVKFYQDQKKKAKDGGEKEFLALMVVEEKTHHLAVTDMKFYLSDPGGWFQEMEKTGLDGA